MVPLVGVAAFYLLVASGATQNPPSDADVKEMWKRFQIEYNRHSVDDVDVRREQAFKSNVLKAYAMNLEQGVHCTDLFDDEQCVFGITKFSDMWDEEFKTMYLGYKPSAEPREASILSSEDLPSASNVSSIDWRTKGAVTPVKNQGDCGSCWAFSTTESVESGVFMASGKLEVLSTQQIISCDKVDAGCSGGDPVTAYKYIEKAGGLDAAKDYPDTSHTTGKTGKCKWDKKKDAKVSGFTYATKPCSSGACKRQDEDAMATAMVTKGPISICVNAGDGWQSYKRGIFSKKCSGASSDLDHCVQVVGFNKSGKKPYWIVRNSWTTDWGVKGYLYLEMGKNLCGVADEATIAQATTAGSDSLVV